MHRQHLAHATGAGFAVAKDLPAVSRRGLRVCLPISVHNKQPHTYMVHDTYLACARMRTGTRICTPALVHHHREAKHHPTPPNSPSCSPLSHGHRIGSPLPARAERAHSSRHPHSHGRRLVILSSASIGVHGNGPGRTPRGCASTLDAALPTRVCAPKQQGAAQRLATTGPASHVQHTIYATTERGGTDLDRELTYGHGYGTSIEQIYRDHAPRAYKHGYGTSIEQICRDHAPRTRKHG